MPCVCLDRTICHLIHQGYSESLANGISMVIKYDRKEMVVLYDFSRRREERGRETQKPTRFPSFFPATAHTLKYERSEELGKNLALGGIYRLPKFLKISKQNKFPQKKLQI